MAELSETRDVKVRRPDHIRTVEVLEESLDNFETIYGREMTALGFMNLALGIAVSTGLSLFVVPRENALAFGIYAGVAIATALVAIYFGVTYFRESAERVRSLTRLRHRGHSTAAESDTEPAK